jgi:hypothetical protein
MSEHWKGDNREFGVAAQEWYAQCLRHFIDTANPHVVGNALRPDHLEALRAWYARQVDRYDELATGLAGAAVPRPRYLLWEPWPSFSESDVSSGEWSFNRPLANANLAHAISESLTELRRAVDLSRVRSLEDWLRRERDRDFIVKGCAGGALPEALAVTLSHRAFRRRRTWPRLCADCSEDYRPDPRRENWKRCAKCLDARRKPKASDRSRRGRAPSRRTATRDS